MADYPELTDEHKRICLANCDKQDLGGLARLCLGETDPLNGTRIDGRHPFAKAIRAFLADNGKTIRTTAHLPTSRSDMVLSDEQKAAIDRLAPKSAPDKSMELIRTVWNDQTITPLDKRARLVRDYLKEVYPEGVDMSEEPVEEREWSPPATLIMLIGLVNQHVLQSDNRKTYNHNVLKPSERKGLEALMRYIRTYRVKYIASSYERRVDRDLFLNTFIRWTHDKPDLTEIEVDQMISAAAETVTVAQLEREIQEIKRYHQRIMDGQVADGTGKVKRFGDAEVEQINGVRTKHTASKREVRDLMKALETARSERQKDREGKLLSVIDLVDAFKKNSDLTGNGPFRDTLLQGGIDEKAEDAKEVARLSALEEAVALISGQTKEEAMA